MLLGRRRDSTTTLAADSTAILVVDDDAEILRILGRALTRAGYRVDTRGSGEDAITALAEKRYDLAVCDIKLPGMDGLELCRSLAESHPDLGVILLTAYGHVEMARSAIRLGASDFITKPVDLASLGIVIERNLERRNLERQRVSDHDIRVMTQSIEALAAAIDARESATARHSSRVAKLAGLVGDNLRLPEMEIRSLELAAVVHDVGKIGVPDCILCKPGPLNQDEWQTMREHAATGAAIVRRIRELSYVGDVVRHHHEWIDGRGYPDGLKGEAIPLLSRIISVADAYEVMTSDRLYRKRLAPKAAIAELISGQGLQFDRAVVEVFGDMHRAGRLP